MVPDPHQRSSPKASSTNEKPAHASIAETADQEDIPGVTSGLGGPPSASASMMDPDRIVDGDHEISAAPIGLTLSDAAIQEVISQYERQTSGVNVAHATLSGSSSAEGSIGTAASSSHSMSMTAASEDSRTTSGFSSLRSTSADVRRHSSNRPHPFAVPPGIPMDVRWDASQVEPRDLRQSSEVHGQLSASHEPVGGHPRNSFSSVVSPSVRSSDSTIAFPAATALPLSQSTSDIQQHTESEPSTISTPRPPSRPMASASAPPVMQHAETSLLPMAFPGQGLMFPVSGSRAGVPAFLGYFPFPIAAAPGLGSSVPASSSGGPSAALFSMNLGGAELPAAAAAAASTGASTGSYQDSWVVRMRPSSCVNCFRSHKRCDRAHPCARCTALGKNCTYPSDQ